MANDREMLEQCREALKEATAELERIADAGLSYGLILTKDKTTGKLAASIDGKVVAIADDKKSKPGDTVLVHPMTMQIVQHPEKLPLGVSATVIGVSEFGIEVRGERGASFVCNTVANVGEGDRVLLDPTQNVALAMIEKAKKPAFAPDVAPVLWDQIGGQEEAKRLLREAIELPRLHAALFAKFGKKPARGILLKGPPGCGKTLMARAIATSVGSDKGGFLSIKGPEVLNEYVGVTERTIRAVFEQARLYREANGREAVIFVDEAESLLAKRGSWGNYMGQTVVPTFLTEMDGLEESSAIVVLATNRDDILDAAILRDGRIDHKIEIQRPGMKDAAEIFAIHLAPVPIKSSRSVGQLSVDAAEVLYSVQNQHLPYSGALIEGIVEKAKSFALSRAIANKRDIGVCQDDLFSAIEQTRRQEETMMKREAA